MSQVCSSSFFFFVGGGTFVFVISWEIFWQVVYCKKRLLVYKKSKHIFYLSSRCICTWLKCSPLGHVQLWSSLEWILSLFRARTHTHTLLELVLIYFIMISIVYSCNSFFLMYIIDVLNCFFYSDSQQSTNNVCSRSQKYLL